jgi:hypothetical protein
MTEPFREPIKKALQSFLVDVNEQRVSEVSAHQVEIVAQFLACGPVPRRPSDGDELAVYKVWKVGSGFVSDAEDRARRMTSSRWAAHRFCAAPFVGRSSFVLEPSTWAPCLYRRTPLLSR